MKTPGNGKTITTTAHGAKMSPRMSRLWTFLRVERGLEGRFHDWSTDEDVERLQAELREAEAVMVARCAAAPDDKTLSDLLRDLRVIAERRPHERTTAAMQKSQAQALRARGMAEDEIAAQIKGVL